MGRSVKATLFRILRRVPGFEMLRDLAEAAIPNRRQSRKAERVALTRIRREIPATLTRPLYGISPGRVLFVGMGQVSAVYLETFLRKSFELAGYRPAVLIPRSRVVRQAYRALGERDLYCLDHFQQIRRPRGVGLPKQLRTLADLLAFKRNGIRCGQYAASTLMRVSRCGSLKLSDSRTREMTDRALETSLDYAQAVEKMLDRVRPGAAVFIDRGYSPAGELFDACLQRGIPAYTWNAAHKNNTLLLKRYTAANADVHPASLSEESWRKMQDMAWSENLWNTLHDELFGCYKSGEWYSEVGTQLNKTVLGRDELERRLRLDPSKKTAVIFPHIFWDATFFWGKDLFGDYETWFNEVLKSACRNTAVNWIIKVHPANLVKDVRDGYSGEHSEITAIRNQVERLPEHVKLLTADTDISTLSLYQIMDYCLTVRGTVGIEAACFGIRVLTAGTGRYDRLGFTQDFQTPESYLEQIESLQQVPAMSIEAIELARKYAYGVFLCRPAKLESMVMEYRKDLKAELYTAFSEKAKADISSCEDIRRISSWICSGKQDYLEFPPASIDIER
jgi:hypothetical protein